MLEKQVDLPDVAALRGDKTKQADMPKNESPNLDFLRTVAVLFVVAFHVMLALQYGGNRFFVPQCMGRLGVVMFFVHTSLVLMFSLERQKEKHGSQSLYSTFLIRRIFRIYPLSMAVVLAIFCGALIWKNNPVSGSVSPWEFVSNFLLIQNLTHARSISGPLWSLPIEVQMYLFLPPLWVLANKLRAKDFIWGVWPASVLLALPQFKYPLPISDVFKFAPCFIPGIICYLLSTNKRVVSFWFLPLLIGVCFASYMILGPHSQTIAGYPVCLALGLGLPFIQEMNNGFAKRVCNLVAKYSYSIYLLHPICLALVFANLSVLPKPLLCLVSILLTGVASFVTYHLIESPLIVWGNRVASRQRPRRSAPSPKELAAEEPTPAP